MLLPAHAVKEHPEDKTFDWGDRMQHEKAKTADTRFHEHTTYAIRYISFNVVTMTLYKTVAL